MAWWRRGSSDIEYLMEHRYDPHVKKINEYVDTLNAQYPNFIPYVSPRYGGVNARVIALQRSPGVKTNPATGGTGFLDVDNPDQAAARHKMFLKGAGIDLSEVLSWNTMPWADPDFDNIKQLHVATIVLAELIEMLHSPVLIMLHGNEAKDMWPRVRRVRPDTARKIRPVMSLSLGWALVDSNRRSQQEIDETNFRIRKDFVHAAKLLGIQPPPTPLDEPINEELPWK